MEAGPGSRSHGVSPNFSKPNQAKPNRTKENQEKPRKKSLDFLGFLRPNRDLSMVYDDSKPKKSACRHK
jgi:hypothetical protein